MSRDLLYRLEVARASYRRLFGDEVQGKAALVLIGSSAGSSII